MSKYLVNMDLNKNELQNAVIQPLASPPSNPKYGQIYTNSTDSVIYQWNGEAWRPVGVVYQQEGSTGAVIVGLDSAGNVTTKKVIELTLTDYTPVSDGYVSAGMTMQQALAALDTAVKNAVAGGGEINQNAWSNITVKQQSTAVDAVSGAAADTMISAGSKTDTFSVASGNKWVDVGVDGKQINIGHSLSGATAGAYGAAGKVAKVTVDAAGHVTKAEEVAITPEAIGADVSGAAAAVLGKDTDTSTEATVYGAKKAAAEALAAAQAAQGAANGKVSSVGATAGKGIEIEGTETAPTVGIKLDSNAKNAASLSENGLMVTIPDVDIPEYTIVKLTTATTGYLASYQLQKDGAGVGAVINIPKDYLVKDVDLKTSTGEGDPSGFAAGTKYIDFTINTYDTQAGSGTETHIYLDVKELVDVYTPGDGIDISDANVISVKVVAENGLSVGADGVKMGLASADANGAMSSSDFSKLAGIDAGATANTITLNGAATKTPNFYAPTAAGTAGQHLVSGGAGTAPAWSDYKYTATNPELTASGGAFKWNVTPGFASSSLIVQVYEVATGAMVMTDVAVASNGNVTITINDTAGAGTLAAGTYRVVIMG